MGSAHTHTETQKNVDDEMKLFSKTEFKKFMDTMEYMTHPREIRVKAHN